MTQQFNSLKNILSIVLIFIAFFCSAKNRINVDQIDERVFVGFKGNDSIFYSCYSLCNSKDESISLENINEFEILGNNSLKFYSGNQYSLFNLDDLDWNKMIRFNSTGYYTSVSTIHINKVNSLFNTSEIEISIPRIDNDILRQNVLYWLSEDIMQELNDYLSEYNIDIYQNYYDGIIYIPSLQTSIPEFCEYYMNFIISFYTSDKFLNDDDGIFWHPLLGGGFRAHVKCLYETESIITYQMYVDSNFGGGSGFGANFNPVISFEKTNGKRITLNDLFDLKKYRTEIAGCIRDKFVEEIPGNEELKNYSDEDYLSMPFGIKKDNLYFEVSRHTIAGPGVSFEIAFKDIPAKFLKEPWLNGEKNEEGTIEFLDFISYNGDYEHKLKNFPSKRDLKKHKFKKQNKDEFIIKNAKTINCGINGFSSHVLVKNSQYEAADRILTELVKYQGGKNLLGYNTTILNEYIWTKLMLADSLKELDKEKSAQLLNDIETYYSYLKEKKYSLDDSNLLDNFVNPRYYSSFIQSYLSYTSNKSNSIELMCKNTINVLKQLQYLSIKLSYNERSDLWNCYKYWLMQWLPKMANETNNKLLKKLAYDAMLCGKGFLLNTEKAIRKAIAASNNDSLRELLENIDKNKTEHNNLLLKMAAIKDEEKLAKQRERKYQLEMNLDHLNQTLSESFDAYSDYITNSQFSSEDVRLSLNPDEVAIEILNINGDDSEKYYALVLHHNDSVPDIVKLFEKPLKDNRMIYDVEILTSCTNGKMYQQVWEPIIQELNPTEKNIYFSPSGILHTLPLEYCYKPSGEKINSLFRISRLSSTRILGHRDSILATHLDQDKRAILIGGLNYNTGKDIKDRKSKDNQTFSYSRSGMVRNGIKPLPATKDEVETISVLLKNKIGKGNVLVLTDERGTERNFKSKVKTCPNLIHIATHGFYLTEEELDKLDDLPYFKDIKNLHKEVNERELYRSGLMFSGVNRLFSGNNIKDNDEDGILTAMEISNLNLLDVDVAVLSACQTGVGDISSEGVAGLQRGFKKAGAKSILASLWKVDDEATALLMKEFYKYLSNGNSKRQSLHFAQKALIEFEDGKYADPYYWASFILIDG